VLAVDAGVHLAAVARILKSHMKDIHIDSKLPVILDSGPFKGLELPLTAVDANAAFITRSLVDTYLITHPHLDHISGFVVNTAGIPSVRPKRLAGLPSTIEAFKNHIFNNIIWPNLSDENNGVGLVTYRRLVDGGSPALGDGEAKGYVEICEGLSVKAMSVSHGHCMEKHLHRGSGTPGLLQVQGEQAHDYGPPQRTSSNPISYGRPMIKSPDPYAQEKERMCVYDSSAYFIRDLDTGREVLIFGDVEADSISLYPRNISVWTEAAPKIVSGTLAAIFIECSYSDSQADDQLYGHLASRFLSQEMKALAHCVQIAKREEDDRKKRKRKRPSGTLLDPASPRRSPRVRSDPAATPDSRTHRSRLEIETDSRISPAADLSSGSLQLDGILDSPISPRTIPRNFTDRSVSHTLPPDHPSRPGTIIATPVLEDDALIEDTVTSLGTNTILSSPLKGLKIVIIHVKDRCDDGEHAGEVILRELREYEGVEGLGCDFLLARAGMDVYL
jgi:cAMP phosphodiesterase